MKESEVKLLLSEQSVSFYMYLPDTPSLYILSADRVGITKLPDRRNSCRLLTWLKLETMSSSSNIVMKNIRLKSYVVALIIVL